MALGFHDGVANRVPDRGLARRTTPRVFSYGEEGGQRIPYGINSLYEEYNIVFANRLKEDIDDIVTFLESKKGTVMFDFTIPDTTSGGEKVIKVVCPTYTINFDYDNYYTLNATIRRVYVP